MNVISAALRRKIIELLKSGYGCRQIARELGLDRTTVRTYRLAHERNVGPITCLCGRPSTHRGRCMIRRGIAAAQRELDPTLKGDPKIISPQ